jgi:hypothetical protein
MRFPHPEQRVVLRMKRRVAKTMVRNRKTTEATAKAKIMVSPGRV